MIWHDVTYQTSKISPTHLDTCKCQVYTYNNHPTITRYKYQLPTGDNEGISPKDPFISLSIVYKYPHLFLKKVCFFFSQKASRSLLLTYPPWIITNLSIRGTLGRTFSTCFLYNLFFKWLLSRIWLTKSIRFTQPNQIQILTTTITYYAIEDNVMC